MVLFVVESIVVLCFIIPLLSNSRELESRAGVFGYEISKIFCFEVWPEISVIREVETPKCSARAFITALFAFPSFAGS